MSALSGRKYRSVALLMLLTGFMFLGSCAAVRLTFLGVLNKDFTPKSKTGGPIQVAVGSIAGRIVTSDGTAPISGAEVTVRQSEGFFFGSDTASSGGTYRVDDLPQGTYEVRVKAPGFVEETRRDVPVATGRTTSDIGFSLVKAGSISGKVTEVDGITPMGKIEVVAFDTSSRGFGTAVTSGDGMYLIGDLSPGNYTVQTAPLGFIAASRTGVSVAAGQETSDISFSLSRSGSISGTVTENDGVTAIRKAEILVFEPNGGVGFAACDTDGTYRVSGLAQGKYEVTVTATGHLRASKTGVTVTSGMERDDIDFSLSRSASISGRVATAQGMTPKVRVQLYAVEGGKTVGHTETEEDGSYTLDELNEGTYDIELPGGRTAAAGIKLADGQATAGIDFSLPAGATVSGRVVERTSSLPIEGAMVIALESIPDERLPRVVNAARTDSGGVYEITYLKTGVYAVEVKKLGYETQKTVRLAVAANQDVGNLDFSMGKMARAGSVFGAVRDSVAGMPLEGAEIRLTDEAGNYVYIGSDNLTDKNGAYAIDGLAPGSFRVYARTAGYTDDWQSDVRVTAGSTTRVDFSMTRGGSVSGTVTAAGDQPAADALVLVREEGSGMDAPLPLSYGTTDENGKYLVEHVRAGVYDVVFLNAEHSLGTATGIRVVNGELRPNVDYRFESK
ncbi:MAG: carboxypeptidase regulatory-like domain-containing protein [candidate division WOR-3 bacterium]|nr:carboxypeptidase regulatory-like domain-containing protein [candidate division WOR-3 bacterium]